MFFQRKGEAPLLRMGNLVSLQPLPKVTKDDTTYQCTKIHNFRDAQARFQAKSNSRDY